MPGVHPPRRATASPAAHWAQPDGTTAYFSNLPHAAPVTAAQARLRPAPEWLELLRDAYAGDVPGRELLHHIRAENLEAFGSVEILATVKHWHRERMLPRREFIGRP